MRGWACKCPGTAGIIATRAAGAHAIHQGQDTNGGNAQNSDLAKGVIAPEVDQDDVDDVGSAAGNGGLVQEVPGNRVMVTREHHPGEPSHARAADEPETHHEFCVRWKTPLAFGRAAAPVP